MVESIKTTKVYSGEINTLQEDLCGEVECLKTEMKIRPVQILEERTKLVFKWLKKENPVEFLLNCEQEMELIVNNVTDKQKTDFISKHFQDSAARWYMIVQDNSTIMNNLKTHLKANTGIIHTQREV